MFQVDYFTLSTAQALAQSLSLSGVPTQGLALDIVSSGPQLPAPYPFPDFTGVIVDGVYNILWNSSAYNLYNIDGTSLVAGDMLRVAYDTTSITDTSGMGRYTVQYFVLDSSQISDQQIMLSSAPATGIAVDVIGGVTQFIDMDYVGNVINNEYYIQWNTPNLGLYNNLSIGDVLRVAYIAITVQSYQDYYDSSNQIQETYYSEYSMQEYY